MLINERHKKILEIVKKDKHITTNKLTSMLYVSEATLRRDLAKMEKDGLIKRTFGGVSVLDSLSDTSIQIRAQAQLKEKRKIALKCLELIKDNSTYFVDSSSTVGVLLDYFESFQNITVITNGLDNAKLLSKTKLATTYMTPGILNYRTNSIIGSDAVSYIHSFNCQYFIFSCSGINLSGINEANFEQNIIKKTMMYNAKTKILLVDSSKFDKIFLSKTASFDQIDYIITDKMPSKSYVDAFKEANVNLIITS